MINTSPKKKKIILILGIVSTFLCVLSYLYLRSVSCTFYLPFFLNKLPSPINSVWPTGNISVPCYYLRSVTPWADNRGIGIDIENKDLQAVGFNTIDEAMVSLFIDEKEVSNQTIEYYGRHPDTHNIANRYNIHWLPILFPGKHNAKVIIKFPSGKNVEYSWEFRITLK